MSPVIDSWELVDRAASGDTDAFGELFSRYRRPVYVYLLSRTHDEPLAEDLASETFVRALRRISSVSYQGRDVGAWFTAIAHNLLADHWKSARTRMEAPYAAPELVASITPSTPAPSAEDAYLSGLDRIEARDRVHAALAELTPARYACVTLRYIQEYSVRDTARHLGISEGAVKARCFQASGALGGLLTREAA